MDFSTGMIANGKIFQALTNGLTLPPGCVRDKNGKPITSPANFMDGGIMLPFGGHKGYCIGLLTCLLGALNGDFSTDDSTMRGMYMQVIQVDALIDCEQYQGFVRSFLNFVQASNPASGFNEVLVLGQSASRIRDKRLEDGIELPDAVFQQLVEWGKKLGVEIPS